MDLKTRAFKKGAASAIADPVVQRNMQGLYDNFHKGRERAGDATPGWEDLRDRARAVKAHTIEHLDYYLDMAASNVEKAGGSVFFAEDAASATQYILDLARARGVKTVVKGKSMLSEEMGLNGHLERAGIEPVETDLGEYLIQLRGETPYHIIAPAVHLSQDQVSDLLQEELGGPRYDRAEDLTAAARGELRGKFIEADMGITGANFLVAETGTLVLVTNEGNGRMCTSMPRVHVAIMGMEKVVPSMEDMGMFLRLLIRSATGQRLSSYVTMVNGPRRGDDVDGPEEFHLVIVDNGRSKMLADPELREALYCLRCGACLNACPVYRKVGGHSYGWVYSGPIGAVVSPISDEPARREGPALRLQPVRGVPRGVPREDRHPADAAAPAQRPRGGRAALRGPARIASRVADDQGVAAHGGPAVYAEAGGSTRQTRAETPGERRQAAKSSAAPVRLDAPPDVPDHRLEVIQGALAGRRAG